MTDPAVQDRSPSGDYLMIEDGAMTGTDVLASKPVNISSEKNVAIDAVWTGTPDGAFKIKGGNFLAGLHDLSALFSPALPAAGGAAGSFVASARLRVKYVQVEYTNSASTGVLNVRMQVKP